MDIITLPNIKFSYNATYTDFYGADFDISCQHEGYLSSTLTEKKIKIFDYLDLPTQILWNPKTSHYQCLDYYQNNIIQSGKDTSVWIFNFYIITNGKLKLAITKDDKNVAVLETCIPISSVFPINLWTK